jgi:transposase
VQDGCEDLAVLRRRLRTLERDIAGLLARHQIGTLLTTTDGLGVQTAARLVAAVGDFSGFSSGAALACYVGVIPALRQSGKRTSVRAGLTPIGAARLRAKLWMPVLSAVRTNPRLRAYYDGLIARGKRPKVALIAATRKLLHAVYSVGIHRRPFVPHVVAPEARP